MPRANVIAQRAAIIALATGGLSATPATPALPTSRKDRTVLQVKLFNTLNAFYVSVDGKVFQKPTRPTRPAMTPTLGHARARTRRTCLPGSTLDYEDGFGGDFHLFGLHANGFALVQLTFVRSTGQWVLQTL